MTEKKYIFTEDAKNINDAINRLHMISYILSDEKPELAQQMKNDLITVQYAVNKYIPIEIKEEK